SAFSPERLYKPFSKHLDLPPPQLRDLAQLVDGFGITPRHSLEPLPGAEHARVEVQFRGDVVAHGFQRRHLRIEVRVAIPSLRPRKLRQVGLRNGETT